MKRAILILSSTLPCAGCFSVDLDDLAREPPAKTRYLLNVEPPQPTARASRFGALLVEQAYAAAPYNARPLVVRTGDTEHRTEYLHEFLVSPADQITEITRRWLRTAGPFQRVTHADSGTLADATLTIDLTEFRGDVRDEAQPRAVVAVRASLSRSENESEQTLLAKDYRASIPTADATAAALVDGLGQGLTKVLGSLTRDIESARNNAPDPGR